ncbi:MAG: hypothetical protein OEZ59_01805 [Deltaproteobacteria bacterium]|nr:hypothetical protein [Deltaproteobacteria bacterium]
MQNVIHNRFDQVRRSGEKSARPALASRARGNGRIRWSASMMAWLALAVFVGRIFLVMPGMMNPQQGITGLNPDLDPALAAELGTLAEVSWCGPKFSLAAQEDQDEDGLPGSSPETGRENCPVCFTLAGGVFLTAATVELNTASVEYPRVPVPATILLPLSRRHLETSSPRAPPLYS